MNCKMPANRRARRTLTWAAVLFVLLQGGIYGFLRFAAPTTRYNGSSMNKTPNLVDSLVQWQVVNMIAAEPTEVIFFGDSSCLMGVMPNTIAARTGQSAWNFG